MSRLLATTALFLLLPAAGASAQTFRAAPDLELGADARPSAIAVGDFNSDGRQDLVTTDAAGHFLRIRLGNGDGTFRDGGKVTLTDILPEDVAVGDFTGDGKEDLAFVTRSDVLRLVVGDGDGGFAVGRGWALPGAGRAVTVGDFDGDGWSDVAAAAGESLAVRRGIGTSASVGRSLPAGGAARSVAAGDFDGNGYEDVAVLVDADPPHIAFALGKGDGDYGSGGLVPVGDPGVGMAVGDLDADGREDVAVAIPSRDRVAVRLGNGGAPEVPVGDHPETVVVADVDADGREDLLTPNASGDSVSVRLGDGFRSGAEVPVGDLPVDIAIGDFDADGREDFAVANHQGGSVSVRMGTAPLTRNLVANGGFEDGLGGRVPGEKPAIAGWTTTGGMTIVRYGALPHFGVPTWLDAPRFGGGRNLLTGGDSLGYGGVTEATQSVSVTEDAGLVDTGRAVATLSAWLGGGLTFADSMSATAEFLDGSGAPLGVVRIGPVNADERRNVTTLLRRSGSAPVPAGTRRVRVTLTSRDSDRWSSAIADNVALTLSTTPPAGDPPPPARASAFGADTRVRLSLAARRVPVRVRVVNGNDFAVSGRLARRRFAVAASGRTTVKLPLTKAQRRRLRRSGRLALRLTASVSDPAGNRRTVVKRVSVRGPRGARSRAAA